MGRIFTVCVVLGLAFWLPVSSAAARETSTGELLLESRAGTGPAILLDSRLQGRVDGLVLSMTLTQRFRNPGDDWVNGKYVFPLPETAAVDSLSLRTGGRVIRGRVREKVSARREYEAAKREGRRAGLLEQQRPNLFTISVANIAPRAEVTAEITWVDTVRYRGDRFTLRLPTTLTPRYIPGRPLLRNRSRDTLPDVDGDAPIRISATSGWALDTDEVVDASAISPPQFRPAEAGDDVQAGSEGPASGSHRFSLDIAIQAGLPLASVTSSTHAIDRYDDRSDPANARLRIFDAPLDRDVVLEWMPTPGNSPRAAVFHQPRDDHDFHLVMLLPPVQSPVQALPREVIFIIDSSGSMAGVSMPRAKRALDRAIGYLSHEDRFNIIDFDDNARALFVQPVATTSGNLSRARGFISALEADGGTNMAAALELAFAQPREAELLRQIVFITDGSVGNEQALFERIHQRLGDARLFTVGIGNAPNSHFMRGAARHGRGSYQFIDALDETDRVMAELFDRINRPLLRDIRLSWPNGGAIEAYPERVPDLHAGEPLMILVRGAGSHGILRVSGQQRKQPWKDAIDLSSAPLAGQLDKLWARRKIEDLESGRVLAGKPPEDIRDALVALGVQYQLLNRFTAFVAVEEIPVRPANQVGHDRQVPNRMPAGNTMRVPVPQTATPALLYALTGGLLLLLSGWLFRRQKLAARA